MRPKSNLICITSRQIHIPNFKSIGRKMTKKSPENEILAKGNNSCKSRSNATKVKLDLYYVMTNMYTKFQVNISKDDWEKFGKPSGRTLSGLTDGRTDWRTDRQTDRMTDGEETYSPPGFTGRGLINKGVNISGYCTSSIEAPLSIFSLHKSSTIKCYQNLCYQYNSPEPMY